MTKIWFPLQRAIRTAVQVIVAGAAILATTVIVAPQILTAIQEVLPGPVVAWIAATIATLAAVSAAISRVTATPPSTSGSGSLVRDPHRPPRTMPRSMVPRSA